jgi:hypothetical protein
LPAVTSAVDAFPQQRFVVTSLGTHRTYALAQ